MPSDRRQHSSGLFLRRWQINCADFLVSLNRAKLLITADQLFSLLYTYFKLITLILNLIYAIPSVLFVSER